MLKVNAFSTCLTLAVALSVIGCDQSQRPLKVQPPQIAAAAHDQPKAVGAPAAPAIDFQAEVDRMVRQVPAYQGANQQQAEEVDLSGIWDQLQSTDLKTLDAAIAKLQKAGPNEEQRRIAARLDELATGDQAKLRDPAIAALARWATVEQLDTLIATLDHRNGIVKGMAIDALARLKDPRGAEAIVAKFANSGHSDEGLIAMGAVAEPAVLSMLDDDNWQLRRSGCQVLKEIGTKKSLQRLEKAAQSDAHFAVKAAAGQAVKSIKKRQS